jgi:hypothetical protein
MNAARAHTSLHNFETSTFSEDDVGSRHTDMLEMNLTMTSGCVYVKSACATCSPLEGLTIKAKDL